VKVHIDVPSRKQEDDRAVGPDEPGEDSTDSDRACTLDDLALPRIGMFDRPMPPPRESARLSSSSTWTGRPASRLAFIAAPRRMVTPTTFVRGLMAFTAAAIPDASPPPERGTRTNAASGVSSMISRPMVP
jgi:hypothetical protein